MYKDDDLYEDNYYNDDYDNDTDEFETRGYPLLRTILKVILFLLLLFLIFWLLFKFIFPLFKKDKNQKIIEQCIGENCDYNQNNDETNNYYIDDSIFDNNINKLKEKSLAYFKEDKLPQRAGESTIVTLKALNDNNTIEYLYDANNKLCDGEKSYVKVTKNDDDYTMLVHLKDSIKEDSRIVSINHYSYCEYYLCEKDDYKEINTVTEDNKTEENNTAETPTISEPTVDNEKHYCTYYGGNYYDKYGNIVKYDEYISRCSAVSTTPVKETMYEYSKQFTYQELSNWTAWSEWQKTSCQTKPINCSDSDKTCLKKLQTYKRKEQVGTYDKEYKKTKTSIKKIGYVTKNLCKNKEYIVIDNTYYVTPSAAAYDAISNINEITNPMEYSWTYNERIKVSTPPTDTNYVHYILVGADFSNCDKTCQTEPQFIYDKYTYEDLFEPTYNNCTNTASQKVPVYKTVIEDDIVKRKEPLYGNVCYQSIKTRDLINTTTNRIKWSTYNDLTLLNDGWKYTGNIK